MKNRSHRYDLNRPKPGYSKYKKSLNVILLICIKQHLHLFFINNPFLILASKNCLSFSKKLPQKIV